MILFFLVVLLSGIAIADVGVSWVDISSNEDGFVIERQENGGEWISVGEVGRDVTEFRDPMSAPKIFRYRVHAFIDVPDGGRSISRRVENCQIAISATTTEPEEPEPPEPEPTGGNLALVATVSATSGDASKVNDGSTTIDHEWISAGTWQEWVELKWPQAVTIKRVVLFDRADYKSHVEEVRIELGDGFGHTVRNLDNAGRASELVLAEPHTITSLRATIKKFSGSKKPGLAELEVYQ